MKFAITKIVFTIILFSQSSSIQLINNDTIEFPNYMKSIFCEDDVISLNFSNAEISRIDQDFISSPLIICLNFMDVNIEEIGKGAFNKLPNLTHLFFSNNKFHVNKLFNFGSHNNLKVLIMNNAVIATDYNTNRWNREYLHIYDVYPSLEILSLRKNTIYDWHFSPDISIMPFPALKILDLSENNIQTTNFLKLFSNNLHFLDLHCNLLNSLDLQKTNKLFALNLDNNHFNSINNSTNNYHSSSLSMAGLTNLHYLSVSTNKINIIESGAFQDNNKLLYLNLSGNYIKSLHPMTFAHLQYLKTLDLSINELENVPQISYTIELSTLCIKYNNITKLISHTFIQMPKLIKLLLGGNRIDEIDVNAFTQLSILEKLDLSMNLLSFLPEGWAESLVSLKYLDLSNNKFTSLESLALTNALPLVEIYLMTNPLEYLNIRYFENLPQNLTINLVNMSNFANIVKNNKKSEIIRNNQNQRTTSTYNYYNNYNNYNNYN